MLTTMLLIGIGFALCFAAINTQATAGVADAEQGLASGLVNTSLQLGGAIALAVVTAILGSGTVTPGHMLPGTHTAVAVILGISGVAMLFTVLHLYRTSDVMVRRSARRQFAGPPAETCELCS
jgi:sugar phosphate permease